MPHPSPEHTIVFFDGVCGLCNRYVDQILAHPQREKFRLSPQQGETYEKYLSGYPDIREIDSIVVLPAAHHDDTSEEPLVRSNAVMHVMRVMGGWRAVTARLMKIVPRPMRDAGYSLVSRWRYRVFGKRDSCRMPTAEEQTFFLP